MKHSTDKSQSGQVGIIILMITAVILTIAISLSQRTLQEQEIAITQDESTRVFNAAESGIEEALFNVGEGALGRGELDFSDLGIEVDYDADGVDEFDMNISSGKAVSIPLNQTSSNVDIKWWDQDTGCGSSNPPAAMIVSIFTQDSAKHYGFDPCDRDNNLQNISQQVSSGFNYEINLNVDTSDTFVRIRPLYNHSRFNVASNAIDLAQYEIKSTGYSEIEDIARTIEVKRSQDGPPHFMDFALISGQGSLVKN